MFRVAGTLGFDICHICKTLDILTFFFSTRGFARHIRTSGGMPWTRSGLLTPENDQIQRAFDCSMHTEAVRGRKYEPAGV